MNDNIFRTVAHNNDEASFPLLDTISDERWYARISERKLVNYQVQTGGNSMSQKYLNTECCCPIPGDWHVHCFFHHFDSPFSPINSGSSWWRHAHEGSNYVVGAWRCARDFFFIQSFDLIELEFLRTSALTPHKAVLHTHWPASSGVSFSWFWEISWLQRTKFRSLITYLAKQRGDFTNGCGHCKMIYDS